MNRHPKWTYPGRSILERVVRHCFRRGFLPIAILLCWVEPGLLLASDPYYAGVYVGQPGSSGNSDGTNAQAFLNSPVAVTFDSAGNAYVADGNAVRRVSYVGTDVVLKTLAGIPGVSGPDDGAGSSARFRAPQGIACNSVGNLFVADTLNDNIRMVTPWGQVTTISGMALAPGSDDGTNTQARFSNPQGIAISPEGMVYVADSGNNTIRKMVLNGGNWVVSTIAGLAGVPGTNDGLGTSARFNGPLGIAMYNTNLLVCDFGNHSIRKLTPSGTNWTSTTFAGVPGAFGSVDGPVGIARFNRPNGIAVDSTGNVFVSDEGNSTLRKITPAGTVSTVAGLAGIPGKSDGVATEARFDLPAGLSTHPAGGVLLADYGNFTVRRIQFGVPLKANVTGNRVVLSWSAVANDVIPQARSSLLTGFQWTNVPGTVQTSGGRCYATNNYVPGSYFFRLYKP
jgi:hypothetical protein